MNDLSYPASGRRPSRRSPHPGRMIASILEDLKIPEGMAARRIGVSVRHLRTIYAGKATVTPRIAAGIGRYLGNGARIWIALQRDYDESRGYLERRDWPYLLANQQYRKGWFNRTILALRPKID